MTSEKSGLDQFARRGKAAGITGPAVATGELLHPGHVEIRGGSLYWELVPDRAHTSRPTPAMFEDFVVLWDSKNPSADILKFAGRWGPLRVDRNGRPLIRTADYDESRIDRRRAAARSRDHGSEPLDAWLFFSRRAYAVIQVSRALKQGKKGSLTDWEFLSSSLTDDEKKRSRKGTFEDQIFCQPSPGPISRFYGMPDWSMREPDFKKKCVVEMGVERLKDQISGELTSWMHRYGVGLSVCWWKSTSPQLEVVYRSGANVLSAVALHLALEVLGGSMYICSSCGYPYNRDGRKRPKEGNMNYCPKCEKDGKEANRLAQRRRRERLGKVARLAADGLTVEQISSQLDWPVAKVRKQIEHAK